MEDFLNLIKFRPEPTGYIGAEREFFIRNELGVIVPGVIRMLEALQSDVRFSPEVPACQIEDKLQSPVLTFDEFVQAIHAIEERYEYAKAQTGLGRVLIEYAPDTMPLDIYPDPRYQHFQETKTREQLLAMCRIAATHFHIGCKDYHHMLKCYNAAIDSFDDMLAWCDYSGGKRIATYKQATPYWRPGPIDSLEHHYQIACERGYNMDIGNDHQLIRMTRYGTIELRMFGVAPGLEEFFSLARRVFEWSEKLPK